MSDHYGYCQADQAPDCKLLADCPLCGNCFAHCFCDQDPDECSHGTPRTEKCEACGVSE